MTTDGPSDATRGSLRLYRDADGHVEVQVRLEHDTLWLSQRQMSALFDKDPDTIGLHLRNIYREGELSEAATTEDSSVVQVDGNKRIAAVLFLWFLDQNGGLLDALCAPRISQDGLVALTLLAAESRASEAEVVVRLIMHMLSSGAVS